MATEGFLHNLLQTMSWWFLSSLSRAQATRVKLTKFISVCYMYISRDLFTVKCPCNTQISEVLFDSRLISLGRKEAPWPKKLRTPELLFVKSFKPHYWKILSKRKSFLFLLACPSHHWLERGWAQCSHHCWYPADRAAGTPWLPGNASPPSGMGGSSANDLWVEQTHLGRSGGIHLNIP